MIRSRCHYLGLAALLAWVLAGCSPRLVAVNFIGNALAGGGGVYTSDNDPELVRGALPFGLKMFESLLNVSPEHEGLLLTAARGFTAYAFLIQDAADRLDDIDLPRARQLRARTRKLYLRGRDYALRGLEVRHPGITAELRIDRTTALARTIKEDVPFLYWAGASWGGTISVAKDNAELLIDLPLVGALVERVLELDEHYDLGAAHEFLISYEASRPGGSLVKARDHYRKALEISRGDRASIHLALAESVVVREQKLDEFRDLINRVLSVDPEGIPHMRLANTIARQRALWLKSRIPELFLEAEPAEKK